MIKLGKVFGIKMVDVAVTNEKLLDRALRILLDVANVDRETGKSLLKESEGSVKLALIMAITDLNLNESRKLLYENKNNIRNSLLELGHIY